MSTVAEMIRPASIGIALALYPSDPSLPMQIQRAPDDGGSPDEASAELLGLAPAGSRTFVDLAPAGPVWWYRSRHISPAGFGSQNWTRWVAAKAKRLPTVLPAVPDIAALDRWTTDVVFGPDDSQPANAAKWSAGNLVLGNGQTFALSAGASETYGNGVLFYLYWDPASPTEIQDSQTFSDVIGDGKIYLATCETTDDGNGSVTIIPVQGAPTIGAKHVRALTVAAIAADLGVILAGLMNNAPSNPTAGIRISSAYQKPATWLSYLDLAATGTEPFLKHPLFELLANGDIRQGPAENLIRNPGFELSDTLMTPWREVVSSQGTWFISSTGARSGLYCLRHDPSGMTDSARLENGATGTRWEATEGDRFYFAVRYARAEAGTANRAQIRIIFRDAAGAQVNAAIATSPSDPGTDYELLEVTGTAGAGTTEVCFEIRVLNDGQSADLKFDDCIARRMVDTTLLVGKVVATEILADTTLIKNAAGNTIGVMENVGGDLQVGADEDLILAANADIRVSPTGDIVLEPQGGTARINFDVPAGGTAGALVGYISVKIQGTERKIPYYAV